MLFHLDRWTNALCRAADKSSRMRAPCRNQQAIDLCALSVECRYAVTIQIGPHLVCSIRRAHCLTMEARYPDGLQHGCASAVPAGPYGVHMRVHLRQIPVGSFPLHALEHAS